MNTKTPKHGRLKSTNIFITVSKKIYNDFSSLHKAQKTLLPVLSLIGTFWIFISLEIFTPLVQRSATAIFINMVLFILVSIIVMLLIIFLMNKRFECTIKEENKQTLLIYMGFSMMLVVYLFIRNMPVNASPDTLDQMNIAITGHYNDWHPFFHTFLFFGIPMKLFGESIEIVSVTHYIYVGLILGYTSYSLYRFGFNKFVIPVIIFLTMINNYVVETIDYPWKDIPYSFGILFMSVNLMWIYITKGDWLNKGKNIFLFILSCFFVLFMRHNGILSYLAAMIALIFFYKKYRKSLAILFIAITASYFIITGPIYNVLEIYKHNESFAEMVGVPNNQLCYIIVNDGEMTDEEREFIETLIPIDVLKENYINGNFNTVKWYADEETGEAYYRGSYVEEHKSEYLDVWLSVIGKNKKLALEAYYYTIRSMILWYLDMIPSMYISVGLSFFIALFAGVVVSLKDFRKSIIFIPMFINMASIMLLMTGDDLRFVLANQTTYLVLLIFAFISIGNVTKLIPAKH